MMYDVGRGQGRRNPQLRVSTFVWDTKMVFVNCTCRLIEKMSMGISLKMNEGTKTDEIHGDPWRKSGIRAETSHQRPPIKLKTPQRPTRA
jgi:hypothetical protein